ncbi:MAG: hypothetical protein D6689_22030 [Deltaproteobacteria bacterium]|nr:MAG: hypothetical protein D6689_22030 [Deltaproteobacteria bacterium]
MIAAIRSQLRRLAADTSGAAIVEATIMLPFFIIVFASVIYMHRSLSAKIDDSVLARECGFAHANSGCDAKKVPPRCKPGRGNRQRGNRSVSYGTANHAGISGLSPDEAGAFRRAVGDGAQKLADMADMILRIGDGTSARVDRRVRRPSVLGGGRTRMRAGFASLCNEKKREPVDVVMSMYCALGDLPGC